MGDEVALHMINTSWEFVGLFFFSGGGGGVTRSISHKIPHLIFAHYRLILHEKLYNQYIGLGDEVALHMINTSWEFVGLFFSGGGGGGVTVLLKIEGRLLPPN